MEFPLSSSILTLQGLAKRGGGGDSCLSRLDAADQRHAAPNRLEGHPSRVVRLSLQEHTASERSSREHHQNNENGLNLADASESLGRLGINGRAPMDQDAPAYERHHWPNFKQEDRPEQRHLRVEDWLAEIVRPTPSPGRQLGTSADKPWGQIWGSPPRTSDDSHDPSGKPQ